MSPDPATLVAAALMTAGLLAKTALFPLHLWLPPAHAGAPPAASAVLSALESRTLGKVEKIAIVHTHAPAEKLKQLRELVAPHGVEFSLVATWDPAAVAAAWRGAGSGRRRWGSWAGSRLPRTSPHGGN